MSWRTCNMQNCPTLQVYSNASLVCDLCGPHTRQPLTLRDVSSELMRERLSTRDSEETRKTSHRTIENDSLHWAAYRWAHGEGTAHTTA
jgi:hypothetical protein